MNLADLMQNPYAWAFLALCTVFSLVFAVVTWLFSRTKKQISFAVSSYELIKARSSTIPKLKLQFDDKEIEALTSTQVTIWNSGNVAIKRDDIVDTRPLILNVDSGEILDVQIIKQNEDSNEFAAVISDGSVFVDFKYIDTNDGVVLKVFHTGKLDSLTLKCKIIGGKKPAKRDSIQEEKKALKANVVSDCIAALSTVMFSLTVISEVKVIQIEAIALSSLVALLFFLLLDLVLIKLIKRVFHIGIPESLK